MSQNQREGGPGVSDAETHPTGTVETAKHAAADVTHTAADEAAGVVETAKSEVGAVAHEAKDQAKQLYAQTRAELTEQAALQQRRVAEGLRSIGGELGSMAENAPDGGVGADLVRQVSQRVEGVAGWIGDRDPGTLLSEVKSYARSKPGTFIAVAALAGLVAGRLTRALSDGAPSSSGASASTDDAGPASASPTAYAGADPAAARRQSLPTDGSIPGAPDGMSGIDTGTAPWGVSGEGDARGGDAADVGGDTPLFDRAGARGSQDEDRP